MAPNFLQTIESQYRDVQAYVEQTIYPAIAMSSSKRPKGGSSSDPELKPSMDLDQWLETLRRADHSFYNLMALEVWSIAKTMDTLIPGFWNRFMKNRQLALKQFMEQKQTPHEDSTTSGEN